MFHTLEAAESQAKTQALSQLTRSISVGQERQNEVIKQVLSVTIRDKLVDPRSMTFTLPLSERDPITLHYEQGQGSEVVNLSEDHALGQLASLAKIPKLYINALRTECVGLPFVERHALLCRILNVHFQKGKFYDRRGQHTKFLHRIVQGELLGVLSRNYNRKMGTAAMLRPFLEECAREGAKPISAQKDRLRVTLQCALPVVFEPVPKEFVAFGVIYSNSDYGAGSLTVQGVLYRIGSGSSMVLEDRLRKIHLGAVISESEIELSEATLLKESAAHVSAVRDMVRHAFSHDNIEQSLALVQIAIEKKMVWSVLMHKVKDLLTKGELSNLEGMLAGTQQGVIDLPQVTVDEHGDAEANAWWASAALGIIAAQSTDMEHKVGIQELAGKLLK